MCSSRSPVMMYGLPSEEVASARAVSMDTWPRIRECAKDGPSLGMSFRDARIRSCSSSARRLRAECTVRRFAAGLKVLVEVEGEGDAVVEVGAGVAVGEDDPAASGETEEEGIRGSE